MWKKQLAHLLELPLPRDRLILVKIACCLVHLGSPVGLRRPVSFCPAIVRISAVVRFFVLESSHARAAMGRSLVNLLEGLPVLEGAVEEGAAVREVGGLVVLRQRETNDVDEFVGSFLTHQMRMNRSSLPVIARLVILR
eukprot:752592-Hanusia_phi.AAC.3